MLKLKVRAVGRASGVILPKHALARLGVRDGDELNLVETPGGYEVTAFDPEFEKQVEIAEQGMDLYKNALRELAK